MLNILQGPNVEVIFSHFANCHELYTMYICGWTPLSYELVFKSKTQVHLTLKIYLTLYYKAQLYNMGKRRTERSIKQGLEKLLKKLGLGNDMVLFYKQIFY